MVKIAKMPILSVAMILLVAVIGCGRKGNPEPPEAFAPKPVRFLSAKPSVNGVLLTWQAPLETADGDELLDLAGYVVRRSVYEKDKSADFEDVAELEVAPLPPVDDAAATPAKNENREISYLDTSVRPGERYDYLVLPINSDGVEGEPLNFIRITFVGESSVVENLPASALE